MSVSLGLVGIVDKGDYKEEAIYSKGNFVLHEGSSWLALKDNLQGVTPVEGDDWKYLARGFAAEILSLISVIDSVGIVGDAGAKTNGQTLMDAIADRVANQLLEKKMMSSVQVNDETMVPTSALVYAMQQALTNLNSNSYILIDASTVPITSGDLNSYTTPGNYKVQTYGIASGISNMPEISAGKLIVEHSNGANNIIQTYKTTTGNIWRRCYTNNAWTTWICNATKSDLKTKVVSGITTDSGAINTNLNADTVKIFSIKMTSQTGFVFMRGDNYATCFDMGMTVLKNTSVTIKVYYIE